MMKKRLAAGLLLAILVGLQLSSVAFAKDDYRYSISPENFTTDYKLDINEKNVDISDNVKNEFVLDEDDRASLTLVLDKDSPYINSGSMFLRFSNTVDGSTNKTYVHRDVLLLPDGSYMAFRPISESITVEDLHLTKEKDALSYRFHFEGEYNAVPVAFETILEAQKQNNDGDNILWDMLDTTNPTRLSIRAKGNTNTPTPLGKELDESYLFWNFALTTMDGVTAGYEVNSGNGWEPLDIASWRAEKDNREALYSGRNFVYDGYRLMLKTAYGEPTTYELLDDVSAKSVAVAAVAAAGTAAIASAATASTGSLSENSEKPDRSILINGGGAYPNLANTGKATAELLLNMDGGDGEIYKWAAIATAPQCNTAVAAAAVPPVGASSSAVIMISGKPLPQEKISVFLEIIATDPEGERITASAELTLYEKGLFAKLNDPDHPDLPESYVVTRVCDANLDGIAEIKTLKPTEYRVEYADNTATIYAEDQSVVLPL